MSSSLWYSIESFANVPIRVHNVVREEVLPLHINYLPDLVLRKIFSNLQLRDVPNIARVCRLWRLYCDLVISKIDTITLLIGSENLYVGSPLELITKSWFTLKHAGKLVNEDGSKMFPVPPYAANRVSFPSIAPSTVDFVVSKFTTLTSLELSINGVRCTKQVIDSIIRLLGTYKSSLVTLKLYIYFVLKPNQSDYDNVAPEIFRLMKTFDNLEKLEHLTLDVCHMLYYDPVLDQCPSDRKKYLFPRLHHLKELNIRTSDEFYDMPLYTQLVRKYSNATHGKLERVGIGNFRRRFYTHQLETDCHKSLAKRFVTFPRPDSGFSDLDPFFKKFFNITKLQIDVFGPQFVRTVKLFAPHLKELISLQFNLYYSIDSDEWIDTCISMGIMTHNTRPPRKRTDNEIDRPDVPQLPSVKLLTFKMCEEGWCDLESRHWGRMFPKVQVIEIETETVQYHKQMPRERDVKKLLRTFKQCPELRFIGYTAPVAKQWTVDQL